MHFRSLPILFAGALLPVAQAALQLHTLTVCRLLVAVVQCTDGALQVTNGTNNADGTPRPSWFINGQTPGPHLVWDEGDEISITVINNGAEPITMHWHG
jgi:FtsP/CotA-like multicopper oxidase with cupredoxin domain